MAVGKIIAIVSVLCTLRQVTCYTASLGQAEITDNRQAKNLFPFVWVTFQPTPCGVNNNGVCVQRGKCGRRGGTANGMCQGNLGECCMFTAQCDANTTFVDVNQLVTTLQTQASTDNPCTFKFKKEPNICQIRLDLDVTMLGADSVGDCVDERIVVSSSITVNDGFTTCGRIDSTKGQHMYLTYGNQDAIEVTTVLRPGSTSKYNIVATRIPCDSINRAPDYCLQYYTKPTGDIQSFGFGGQQQNNQKYTACVKPLASSKSVTWKPCAGTTNSFDIISTFDPPTTCTTDYVIVRGDERRCTTFPQVTSSWKPYELMVNFDETELPEPLPGFNLYVDPLACTPATCEDKSVPMAYTCACRTEIPTNQTCQCDLMIPELQSSTPDFNNKGFCLTYTQ